MSRPQHLVLALCAGALWAIPAPARAVPMQPAAPPARAPATPAPRPTPRPESLSATAAKGLSVAYPSATAGRALNPFTATAPKALVAAYASPRPTAAAVAHTATATRGLSVSYPTPVPKGKP